MLRLMSPLRCSLTPFAASLTRPLSNSNHIWSTRAGLLLRIQRKDGSEGLGEASPLPNYSPDSLSDCERCLADLHLFPEDELCLLRIQEFVDHMPAQLPAARFAVETALLDLLSQERGESVSQLLGGESESASRSALIDSNNAIASVALLLERGIRAGKLKVGRNWTAELATIRTLGERFPSFRLRLDVNGAWSLPQALQNLQTLGNQRIDFVEQPVQPAKMHNLVGSPVPIAADESMHSKLGRDALGELVGDSALVAVVLKPTVLGGALACMRHVRWAKEHGVASVASHCFEGAVGTAAVAELAIAIAGPFAAGVDRHDALDHLPEAHIPQLQHDGLHRHRRGLGVTFAADLVP
jgi:o-succinylbenzoate synthase